MKANEAPEKIFLFENPVTETPDDRWLTHRSCDSDIEYIRTDAFIEKAEDFISRKICDYIVHYNYGPNNDMETMYVDSRFFDDFKNHIKGE